MDKFFNNVVKLGEQLNERFKEYNHDFTFNREGLTRYSGDWATIFVRNENDVQVGKITVQNVNDEASVYYFKSYKKFDYAFDLGDLVWIALGFYLHKNVYYTKQQMLDVLEVAKQDQERFYQEHKTWREQNPKFKVVDGDTVQVRRKGLKRKNLRVCVENIIREEVYA